MNLKKNKYLVIFEDCQLVKGSYRSIIYDLNRKKYDLIPNDLYDLLNQFNKKTVSAIYKKVGIDNREVLDEYLDFLTSKEYVFFCDKDELNFFPKLNLTWESPSIIQNAIIDINEFDIKPEVFTELENLGCFDIQIRCFSTKPIDYWNDLLDGLKLSRIKSIEIYTKYSEEYKDIDFKEFYNRHKRLRSLIIHSTPIDIKNIESGDMGNLIYIKQDITDSSHCGFISHHYFNINITSFTEAQHHNSCLNRKIGIDVDGNIRNCPAMTESFGNVKNSTLQSAIDSTDFKKYWNVNKDQIEICKDCEFRYMCIDCRAFTEAPTSMFSKPAKCSYDPYTGVWGNENTSNNPLFGT